MMKQSLVMLAAALAATAATPSAAQDEPVELARCSDSMGTIAVVDGEYRR